MGSDSKPNESQNIARHSYVCANIHNIAMMLGKQVKGLDAVVVERVDNLVMGEILNWWKKRKELAFG